MSKKPDPTLPYYTELPACHITGKISLKNRKIPAPFAKHHRRKGGKTSERMESYKCPEKDCPYYHLTKSKPKHLSTVHRPPMDHVSHYGKRYSGIKPPKPRMKKI